MDLLNQNINNDFEKEMNIEDKTSIKYISNEKALKFLSNIENISNEVIKKIKSRINNINIYESYSENNDIINDINNKTFIEYINDIYINVIYKVLNIKPEYLNQNNDINKNKNLLFNISTNITNIINNDIKEINEYIFSYSKQYIEKNIYNIHYNLYYFRKSFLNDEMSNLLNEFYSLVNRTIKVHLIQMIKFNFDLAYQVFREEDHYFSYYSGKDRRFLTSAFVERYYEYKTKFEEYLLLTYSEDFLNLLEKYFYKLRDDILNYVKNKIFSVNKYYFNHKYYKKLFYFNEQANNEILKIIDNINNYYNEINIDGDIKLKAVNLSQEILKPYHSKQIKYLDKFYNHLYDRTTDFHIKDDEKDFVYSYWKLLLYGWKNRYIYTKHHNNINLVLKDLNKTDVYLLKETNIILVNFISKFDKYLNKYISYCQNLYSSLYQYSKNKINEASEKTLIIDYFDIFNKIIKNDSNEGLMTKIYNQVKNVKENINIYINTFSSNIKLLKDQYYDLYFLPNYKNFLEYPEEIVYKINQYYDEALFNIDNIKSIINYIYKKRIKYIIQSTNIYINNFIKQHIKYIKVNINSSYIFDEYYISKYSELDNLYNNCIFINNNNNLNDNDISILDEQSYNNKMEININYINDFILFLENKINETFIDEICEENMRQFNSETICHNEKKKFNLTFSKYNYNIVKLRTSIYYSKTLLENIDTLFDEYNFHDIINGSKIQFYDGLLNDKNILEIYNKTNYKIIDINKESEILMNELYQYFLEDFKIKYSFEKDYLSFIKRFEEIIKFENEDYNRSINDTLNEIIDNAISLLNEFNQTLIKQLSIRQNYTYYNFNQTYFKNMFMSYKSSIKKKFTFTKENITNLNNNYIFHNSIKTILSKLQLFKRNYIKNTINDFAQNYDYKLLNISYNLGEKLEYTLEKEYDDYEFTFIYDYVKIFENYTKPYINKIIEEINSIENKFFENLENIYNNFYHELVYNASLFMNLDFIESLIYNQTKCSNYINYTLTDYRDDDEQYTNIVNNINLIISKCSNDIINLNLSEKILYIFNMTNQCSNISDILKNNSYYNETVEMMDCFIHDNYKYNYTFIYFNNFNDTIKEDMENIIYKIDIILKKNKLDENFIYDFLEKQNYHLEYYEGIELSDISYNFEDIENNINYINYIKNNEYKNFLYDLFISSLNSSYLDFINNFILEELMDDIIISINNRLEIHLDYMTKKIKDEYFYYLLILNTTDELGFSSKMALINLYEKIKIKLNETMFYIFEDDINFYLDLFFRENKKMFRNNFLNYYLSKNNEYNINIFKIKEFSDEIILESRFNKTIDEISKHLVKDIIIGNIKKKINDLIYSKIEKLYNIIEEFKVNMEEILNNKTTRPLPLDMIHINEIIINFTDLVNNQKNRYFLNISEKPFNYLYEFIYENLEPPLSLIKKQYNTIEERLLNEISKIIEKFPNYYIIIKDKLSLETMNENITPFIDYVNETIFSYIEILDKDIKSYINKLIHYTYIYGIYYQDSPCADSFCFNEHEVLDNNYYYDNITDSHDRIRRLDKNIKNYIFNGLFNFSHLDKEKINKFKNRKLQNF